MTYRNDRILKACRDLPCQSCGAVDGTVVGAHQNESKGMGIKASDARVMALCYRCHAEYDQGGSMTREEKREFAWRMIAKTYVEMMEQGLLEVKRG